ARRAAAQHDLQLSRARARVLVPGAVRVRGVPHRRIQAARRGRAFWRSKRASRSAQPRGRRLGSLRSPRRLARARSGVSLPSVWRRHGVGRAARAVPFVLVGGGAGRTADWWKWQYGRVMEQALEDALADLKRVLEGAVDAAIILDQDCHVLYRNSAYDAYT